MKLTEPLPENFEKLAGYEFFSHDHLPVVAAYCRHLGLAELVDRMVPSQMGVRPGLVVQAMVLNTLADQVPLYRLEEFLAGQDIGLLLGEEIDAHAFSDTNLARAMEAIFEAGPARIVAAAGAQAARVFALPNALSRHVSREIELRPSLGIHEPLSVRTCPAAQDPVPLRAVVDMLCVDRDIPVFGRVSSCIPRFGDPYDEPENPSWHGDSDNSVINRRSTIHGEKGFGLGVCSTIESR